MDAQSIYLCHAFHDSLPGGKASGHLGFDQFGLNYEVGSMAGRLPFTQLNFALGGAGHRLVFITHPLMPKLTLYTSDLTILKDLLLLAHPECAPQIRQAHQQRQKHWGIFVAAALIMLALPVAALWNMDWFAGLAAKKIPVSWENKLGETATAQYRISHQTMSKEQVELTLRALVAPLLSALPESPYQYQFSIVNDGSLNAFALPGGFVTIHSGLILRADSADELLGVLAHEISHVEERHGVRSVIGNLGIYAVASLFLGDITGIMASVANAAPMLMSQQYSRAFETEADEKGAKLMIQAKIDPEGLPRFFEKIIAEEKATLDKIENEEAKAAYKAALTFLSTHPASEKRMARLRELSAAEQGDYRDLSAEFAQLKTAVKQFVENSPAAKPEPASESKDEAAATEQ